VDGLRPAAGVVIPTWNGARFLGPCLAALAAQTRRDFEVLVVDNGSTDDTAAVLAEHPEARHLRLARNEGFAVACNAGIAASRGEVVVLLNNDTEVEPGWLAALLAALEGWPEAGMAQPKVLVHGRPDTLHTTGDTVDLAARPANRGAWQPDDGRWDVGGEVFGVNAAAGAYRRSMLDDVGVLEPRFGSYLEDVDLAWRARLRGWRCVYVPEARVLHHVSATGGGAYASYQVARNRWWLIARCYPTGLLLRHGGGVLRALAGEAADALAHWRGEAARATLRGLLAGAFTWPRMLASRRAIQASRRVDDATLARWMAGDFESPSGS
jgi:GT2 family glycosyltransferase